MFFSEYFGENHPKYADTLIDYGFYLLNVDHIVSSVFVYEVGPGLWHRPDFPTHYFSEQQLLNLSPFKLVVSKNLLLGLKE